MLCTWIILPAKVNECLWLSLCCPDALTGCFLGSLSSCSFMASLWCQVVSRNCSTPMFSIPDLDLEGIIGFRLHDYQSHKLSCWHCLRSAASEVLSLHLTTALICTLRSFLPHGYCPEGHIIPGFTIACAFSFLQMFILYGGLISESRSGQRIFVLPSHNQKSITHLS